MNAEAVDGSVFNMVEDQCRTQVWGTDLKAHVLHGYAVDVAGIQPIGRHGPHHKIFACYLRQVAPGGVFCGASAAKGEVHILE